MPDLLDDVRANGSSSAVFIPKTPWFFVGNGAEGSTTALVEARLRSNLRGQLAYQTASDGLEECPDTSEESDETNQPSPTSTRGTASTGGLR